MSQSLLRKTLKVFGFGGTTDDFEQFGSLANGSANFTKDIPTIQSLGSYWTDGWRPALLTAKAPVLQDMNGVMYVHSYLEGYLFQEGVPEWDAGTTYNTGSVVKVPWSNGVTNTYFYVSLADANLNNALPSGAASNASWGYLFGITGSGLVIPGTATNDDAGDGIVGQIISSIVNDVTFPSTGQFGDATSISLSSGDWEVSAQWVYNPNGASHSDNTAVGISQTSGNASTGLVSGSNRYTWTVANGSTIYSGSIAGYRQSLSTTTTIYLKFQDNYGVAVPHLDARLSARRLR